MNTARTPLLTNAEQPLGEQDAALSGEDRFTSLEARDQYLRALRWQAPLSPQEEARYLERLRRGKREQAQARPYQWRLRLARDAQQALFSAHLPLVSRIASWWWRRTEGRFDLLDLIQEGNLILFKALERCPFDGSGNVTVYLRIHIHNGILNALCKYALIYVPAAAQRGAEQNRRAELLRLCHPISIEQQRSDQENEASLRDLLEAPALILSPPADCPAEKVHLLALLLAEVLPQEREVLWLRYGLSDEGIAYPTDEVARRLRLSERTVGLYEQRALRRLRILYEDYERETGRTSPWFASDEAFASYLEQRRMHKAPLARSTRVVNAHLYEAFTAMQEAGESISSRTLAKRAQVGEGTATRYLRSRGYNESAALSMELSARLEHTFLSMQEAGESISSRTLAKRAQVSVATTARYLQRRGYNHDKELSARLEHTFLAMQEAGESITGRALATRAQISYATTLKYLRSLQQQKGQTVE